MRPPQPWRLEPSLRFFAMLPMAFALGAFATEACARAAGMGAADRPAWLLAAGTGVFHILALLAVVPLVRAHNFRWRDAFGFLGERWASKLALAAILTIPALVSAVVVFQACGWLLDRLGIPYDTQLAVQMVRDTSGTWECVLLFVPAALTAPIVEEILFRGVLWPMARDNGWRILGCLGVSLLFAIIHFNHVILVPLWLLGIFWTWLYEKTGDLTAPILSHALFNATNFVFILLAPHEGV